MAIDSLLPSLSAWKAGEEWRPVELHGRYLASEQLLVRNRVFNGNPGFEVLVPFQLDDGRVFVVDRGWLSLGPTPHTPESVPAAPSGDLPVRARLPPRGPGLPARARPPGPIPATSHT